MSSEALLAISRNLAIVAVITVVLQAWLMEVRRRALIKRVARERLVIQEESELLKDDQVITLASGYLEKAFIRAGVQLTQFRLTVFILIAITVTLGVGAIFGVMLMLFTPFLLALAILVFFRFQYQRRRRVIYESLPTIVDGVVRSVDAGRSLEQALVESFATAPDVFEPLVFRLRSATESGRDYTHLMDQFAELYEIPPLVFVAVALRTSSRFGSSIRPVLKQVSESLRAQEQLRREFMAATAETRLTALIFAVLPPGLGVVAVMMNESFKEVLFHTPAGNKMLMIAAGLILTGGLIILRMVQGVGRD